MLTIRFSLISKYCHESSPPPREIKQHEGHNSIWSRPMHNMEVRVINADNEIQQGHAGLTRLASYSPSDRRN
jgi:hypothetical protein